jgi:acetoin utilization deacetylase AcuC-like enzyme
LKALNDVNRLLKTILITIPLASACSFSIITSATEAKAATTKIKKLNVAILFDTKFLLHDTGPNHPERPDRLIAVIDYLKSDQTLVNQLLWPKFKPATIETISLAHTYDYIHLVKREVNAVGKGKVANLSTGDTVISPHTFEVARLAVGAGVAGTDAIMSGNATSAFALVRPPGHHATSTRGMGFCIFNTVAITAKYLQKHYGLKRILIVDFDVHHGNGTQDIFYDDDSVFYFSVHQHPFYPGTGRPNEIGMDAGRGYTLNVDLAAGSGDAEILNTISQQLKPAMEKFKPEFILVSAGFDAHAGDLLGQLNYTDTGYQKIAQQLSDIALEYADGKIMYVLEGGYSPENIKNSVKAIIEVLLEKASADN